MGMTTFAAAAAGMTTFSTASAAAGALPDPVPNPAPGTLAGGVAAVAVLVLLAEFLMLRTALPRAQIRLYAAQSLLVVAVTAMLAAGRGLPDLYGLAVASFVLKVIAVPVVAWWFVRHGPAHISGTGVMKVPTAALISIVVAAFGFFVTTRFVTTRFGTTGFVTTFAPGLHALSVTFGLGVAVVLVAFVVMAIRRDVVSQAVGFFSLENGIAVASLALAAGMPLIVEVVLLFDLLVAAIAVGLIMRAHRRRTDSLSTATLNRLRG